MKKQIISLMMGASLFASTHVVAMEEEYTQIEPKNKNPKILMKIFSFEGNQKEKGLGIFHDHKTPLSVISYLFDFLEIKDLQKMSQTSKIMYNLCAKSHTEEIKALNTYLELFTQKIPYTLSIEMLMDIQKAAGCVSIAKDQPSIFSIGKNWFTIKNNQVGKDHLELCEKSATKTFTWDTNLMKDLHFFGASISVSTNSPNFSDLDSLGYTEQMYIDFSIPNNYKCSNYFLIYPIELIENNENK